MTTTKEQSPGMLERPATQAMLNSTSNFLTKIEAGKIETENLAQLNFLLVSGRSNLFRFDAKDTVKNLKTKLFESWPNDWLSEKPTAACQIRFLHLGRFLEDGSTLEEVKIFNNKKTTIHINIKQAEVDSATGAFSKKSVERIPKCGLCLIL